MNSNYIEALANELDLADTAQLLALVINKDAEYSDEQVSLLHDKDKQIQMLKTDLSVLEEENRKLREIADKTDKAISNLEKRHNELVSISKKALDDKEYELAAKETELKPFKEAFGTVKKGRERLKRLQKANELNTKKMERLIKENRTLAKENKYLRVKGLGDVIGDSVADTMENVCWRNEDDTLMFFHKLIARKDKPEGIPGLIFISPTGSAGIVTLGDDGEPELARQPRGGHKPKKATAEFAKQWLTKVQTQGKIKAEDLDALKNNYKPNKLQAA
ncbi:hypothetical protein [Gayadomonas joobiniege]|uniref:hypothetical protein n=1 Tax=Gayadomonas joobiniege TaxID=1234606 RepID=UPI00036D6AD2|nr:hypothetical protein [Gayadomonas joobiniege]